MSELECKSHVLTLYMVLGSHIILKFFQILLIFVPFRGELKPYTHKNILNIQNRQMITSLNWTYCLIYPHTIVFRHMSVLLTIY
jgi:hypothetical protein